MSTKDNAPNLAIRMLRKRGLGTRPVARALGRAPSTVARWFQGSVPDDDAKALCERDLGIPQPAWEQSPNGPAPSAQNPPVADSGGAPKAAEELPPDIQAIADRINERAAEIGRMRAWARSRVRDPALDEARQELADNDDAREAAAAETRWSTYFKLVSAQVQAFKRLARAMGEDTAGGQIVTSRSWGRMVAAILSTLTAHDRAFEEFYDVLSRRGLWPRDSLARDGLTKLLAELTRLRGMQARGTKLHADFLAKESRVRAIRDALLWSEARMMGVATH